MRYTLRHLFTFAFLVECYHCVSEFCVNLFENNCRHPSICLEINSRSLKCRFSNFFELKFLNLSNLKF